MKDLSSPIELEKLKVHSLVDIITYRPKEVVSQTIVKKTTGNITLCSFAAGEELAERIIPFDIYIQIIDGSAGLMISDKQYTLNQGEVMIIPAHSKHNFNAYVQFKMISAVIKSGYED